MWKKFASIGASCALLVGLCYGAYGQAVLVASAQVYLYVELWRLCSHCWGHSQAAVSQDCKSVVGCYPASIGLSLIINHGVRVVDQNPDSLALWHNQHIADICKCHEKEGRVASYLFLTYGLNWVALYRVLGAGCSRRGFGVRHILSQD